MPRKRKNTKGQKPRQRKTERKELDPVVRARIVTLRQEGYTERAIEEKTGVKKSTMNRIYKHTIQRSTELQVSVDDPRCYQSRQRPGRPIYPSHKEAERIFEYTVSTLENRRKTAMQLIQELDVKGTKPGKLLSESKFKQIMYDRGYGRKDNVWEQEHIIKD